MDQWLQYPDRIVSLQKFLCLSEQYGIHSFGPGLLIIGPVILIIGPAVLIIGPAILIIGPAILKIPPYMQIICLCWSMRTNDYSTQTKLLVYRNFYVFQSGTV